MSFNNKPRSRRSVYSSANHRGRNTRGRRESTIDINKFIRPAKPVTIEEYTPTHSFEDFEVSPIIKQNLAKIGYKTPTPIQDQAIPVALSGRDVVGIAHTGTGKTCAFAVPVFNKLLTNRGSKALIIAPTRELAQQIEAECIKIAKGSGMFGALLIGGDSMGRQLRDLRSGPSIVIGTPGRIKDHINRGSLDLSKFDLVVLDEVDRMLDMGFINDVTDILSNTKEQRQSFFFSATMEPKIQRLIDGFVHDPAIIVLKTGDTSDQVHQDIVRYESTQDRMAKLHDLLISQEVAKAIIFDETQRSVERLSNELASRGFNVDSLHGGKSQGQRMRALKKFKNSEVNILVATDVASRGIDISDITHVINYTTPKVYEDYVHRVGRAGRAGRVGYALTFVSR